jgi:hypothetical protein
MDRHHRDALPIWVWRCALCSSPHVRLALRMRRPIVISVRIGWRMAV